MGRRTRETTGSIYTGASNPKTCIERQQRWGCVEIQSNSFTDLGPGASLTVNCQQSFIESNQKNLPSFNPTLQHSLHHCLSLFQFQSSLPILLAYPHPPLPLRPYPSPFRPHPLPPLSQQQSPLTLRSSPPPRASLSLQSRNDRLSAGNRL